MHKIAAVTLAIMGLLLGGAGAATAVAGDASSVEILATEKCC